MRASTVGQRYANQLQDTKKQSIVLPRGTVSRVVGCSLCVCLTLLGAVVFAGWEIRLLRGAAAAERRASLQAAHEHSVTLARVVMELQAELDAQEDHDRNVLQLYLQLEQACPPTRTRALPAARSIGWVTRPAHPAADAPPQEKLPQLHRKVSAAGAHCGREGHAIVETALNEMGTEMHRHAQAMLDKLQRQGGRNRRRAQELAAHISSISRADRARQRAAAAVGDGLPWSDSDLVAPLEALEKQLSRPNATFELSVELMSEWEKASTRQPPARQRARTLLLPPAPPSACPVAARPRAE